MLKFKDVQKKEDIQINEVDLTMVKKMQIKLKELQIAKEKAMRDYDNQIKTIKNKISTLSKNA